MANLYGTLTQIRARLPGLTATGDDMLLLDYLEDASRFLDTATGRNFYPKIVTRYYDHPHDDRVLLLDDDLLEVTTFTTQNTSTTVTSGQYYLMCGDDYNLTPYDRIVMKSDGTRPNLLYSGTLQKANAVTGIWGYHDDYANAWKNSGDEVENAGGITASGTSITVADDANFERGQTLKIESEFLYLSVASSDTLTVERGVGGSTAATHAKDTDIFIWRPYREVQRACLRLAAWLYKQRESPYAFVISTDGEGQVIVPPDAPPEVHRFVKGHRR